MRDRLSKIERDLQRDKARQNDPALHPSHLGRVLAAMDESIGGERMYSPEIYEDLPTPAVAEERYVAASVRRGTSGHIEE